MKTVMITGASRGIGRELALAFARAGYAVGINYLQEKIKAEAVAAEIIQAGAQAACFPGDVRSSQTARQIMEGVVTRWGRLDVLINNAGISGNRTILKMTDEEWTSVIDTNLNGVFWCLREAARIMAKQKTGSIVNLASYLAFRPSIGAANYSASKAAVVALTRTAARELGRFGVRVNALCPGFHQTAMGSEIPEEVLERVRADHVLDHTTRMEDLSRMALELAGNESISGQIINVDSRIP